MTMPTRAGVSMAIHATARRVVGDPPGAVRMTRGHVRTLLVRFDAPAFYSLARKYACYRGTSSRGLQPGKGDGYGTEFVFLGSGDTMRVIVVDPRTTCVCTLPILSFLSRGIAYWDTYPCGWATSRSVLPMPADCLRGIKCYLDTRSDASRRTCTSAILRYLGLSPSPPDAAMSPAALVAYCRAICGIAWRIDEELVSCSIDLFRALETRHCRRLLAWQNGVQPRGHIVNGRLVAPHADAMLAMRHEIVHSIVQWANSITPSDLVRADPAYAEELALQAKARKRKRASVAGPQPPCVTRCLMPTAATGYAKDGVRWRVGAVISAVCGAVGMDAADLVDVAAASSQWALHGSPDGLRQLLHNATSAKQYTVTCAGMNRAGGCPYAGNVAACAASRGVDLPLLAHPSEMWQQSALARAHPAATRIPCERE